MKRVLHIGLSQGCGGIENCVMNYFRELAKYEVIFDFIDIYGDGIAYSKEIESLGGRIIQTGNYKKDPLGVFRRLVKIIHTGGYDAVHVHMLSAASLIPVKASLKAGVKPILHSHTTATVGTTRRLMHIYNRRTLRNLSVVRVACSRAAGHFLHRDKSFEVVPNAIDAERFRYDPNKRKQIRDMLRLPGDAFVIGFVGRFSLAKNPLYLVRILAELKKRMTCPVKLMLVGDGELKKDIMTHAGMFGVQEDILYVGTIQDTAGWYSAMDVFLLPSIYEGFPLAGIEAQASGLHCLFSTAVTRELSLTEEVNFLGISQDDVQTWADNLMRVYKSDRKRSDVSGIVHSPYNIKISAKRLIDLYFGTSLTCHTSEERQDC